MILNVWRGNRLQAICIAQRKKSCSVEHTPFVLQFANHKKSGYLVGFSNFITAKDPCFFFKEAAHIGQTHRNHLPHGLTPDTLPIPFASPQHLLMRPTKHTLPALDPENTIRPPHRTQPMRHHQHRHLPPQPLNRFLQTGLRLRV